MDVGFGAITALINDLMKEVTNVILIEQNAVTLFRTVENHDNAAWLSYRKMHLNIP